MTSPSRALARVVLCTALVVGAVLWGAVVPAPVEARTAAVLEEVPVEMGAERDRAGMSRSAVQRTRPFAMVGFALVEDVEVHVRTALGDGPWSAWVPVPHTHDEGPDPAAADAGERRADGREVTHPVFTGPADRLQVRTRGGSTAGVVALVVDPFGLGRSRLQRALDTAAASWRGTPPDVAAASADTPPIVTREQWGADESIVRDRPSYARQVDRVFIHHTVGGNGYTAAQAAGVVRGVMEYHVEGRGWSDIGYNFLVDRFGTIYQGRAGGIDRPVIGAQAGGFNAGSQGVALMGDFSSVSPPAEAIESVEAVTAWLADVHHFDPLGTSVATSGGSSRYPAGVDVTLPNITGHRDVSSTDCPGGTTYALLEQIRTAVREGIGDMILDHGVDVTTTRVVRGDPEADAVTVRARLDPPGRWMVEARGPDGAVLLRATGEGAEASATLPLEGDGWALGDYTLEVSAPGRRPATDSVRLVPPVITGAAASTGLALVGEAGVISPPVGFGATLWPGASWELEVADPAGTIVHRATGTGHVLDAEWAGPVGERGTYAWILRAEDAVPATGSVEVRHDLLERLADTEDPIAAAAAISAATFDAGEADHAVVARADLFADALAGGPLAGREGPLLLTPSTALDSRVVAELDRVLAPDATIFVLGGASAIDEAVAADLRELGTVRRLAGPSRVATAAAVAREVVERTGVSTAMVARAGPDDVAPWADALAGGAFGAATGVPVLLTASDRLSAETAAVLDELDIASTIVLGGTAAVGQRVLEELPTPRRVAGADRTATAAAVAAQLWTARGPVDEVVLANGVDGRAWVWALAAAPLAARRGAPLLLTGAEALSGPTAEAMAALGVVDGVILGPPALVAADVGYGASDVVRGR